MSVVLQKSLMWLHLRLVVGGKGRTEPFGPPMSTWPVESIQPVFLVSLAVSFQIGMPNPEISVVADSFLSPGSASWSSSEQWGSNPSLQAGRLRLVPKASVNPVDHVDHPPDSIVILDHFGATLPEKTGS